jgi:integrase
MRSGHTLRRAFASLIYEAGGQPTDVMSQMGQKSSALALEVYARRMNRERDTGARMDALVDWARMGRHKRPIRRCH